MGRDERQDKNEEGNKEESKDKEEDVQLTVADVEEEINAELQRHVERMVELKRQYEDCERQLEAVRSLDADTEQEPSSETPKDVVDRMAARVEKMLQLVEQKVVVVDATD